MSGSHKANWSEKLCSGLAFSAAVSQSAASQEAACLAVAYDGQRLAAQVYNLLVLCADIIEMQAMDRDLFTIVLRLLQHNTEVAHRKLRRTEPSPSNSPGR